MIIHSNGSGNLSAAPNAEAISYAHTINISCENQSASSNVEIDLAEEPQPGPGLLAVGERA